MKKNILIGVLLVVTLLSMLYAFVQKAEAEKVKKLAFENLKVAEEVKRESEECRRSSEQMQQALADALAATEAQVALAEKAAKKK